MPSRKSSPETSVDRYQQAEKQYTQAMKLFLEDRDWAKAKGAFEAFLDEYEDEPVVLELCDRARSHLTSCQKKVDPPRTTPNSGSDWLIEAVFLSNEGQLDAALDAYEKALASGAEEAKVYYARAATLARAERGEEAIESLRLSIEADPDNRAFALGDPDFERVRELAGFVSLVEPPGQKPKGDLHGSPSWPEQNPDI